MALANSAREGTKPKKTTTPKAPIKHTLSSEMIDDSTDSSSASENDAPVPQVKVTSISPDKAAKKRRIDVATEARVPNGNSKDKGKSKGKNTQKQDTPSSTSSSDSDSNASSSSEEAAAAANGTSASDESASESGDNDSDDDDDDDDDSDESSDAMRIDKPQKHTSTTIAPTARATTTHSGTVQDWVPPPDYSRIPVQSTAKLLTPKALKGKQIWHISIPVGVPVEKLKVIRPDMMEKGAVALTDGGAKYTLRETRKRDVEGARILVASAERNEYEQLHVPVSRTLELRQVMVGMDAADEGEEVGEEVNNILDPKLLVAQKTYPKAPPPEQRTGLRYMNTPIGVMAPRVEEQFQRPRAVADVTNGNTEMGGTMEETAEERAQRKADKARRKADKEAKRAARAAKK